jgi:hypothetical protein
MRARLFVRRHRMAAEFSMEKPTEFVILLAVLLVWPFLPIDGRCTGLLLHLFTFSEAYARAHARAHTHTHTHTHTRCDSPGRGIGPSQRPLPDNIQQTEETYIHALSGIQTGNPRNRVATDVRTAIGIGALYNYDLEEINYKVILNERPIKSCGRAP